MSRALAFALAPAFALALTAAPAAAQFVGPEVSADGHTVAEVADMRLGRYVTLTGNIVSHLRSDYYLFQDGTGEIRVEIEPPVWRGREVTPETTVRLLGEIDRGIFGRYIWVKSLIILP